jgi:hypothetical protein
MPEIVSKKEGDMGRKNGDEVKPLDKLFEKQSEAFAQGGDREPVKGRIKVVRGKRKSGKK